MARRLLLSLDGNFCLRDESGIAVPVRNSRARALLAILATTRDRKRSRIWLQTCLWENSQEEQASASLRQTLTGLRKALGTHADLLEADRTYVAIPMLELGAPAAENESVFFEDAPDLGETFDDWLRMERAAFAAVPVFSEKGVLESDRFCVVVKPPQILSDDPIMPVLAALICDRIIDGLRAHGAIDIFDLRDLGSNQLSHFPRGEPPQPDAALQIRALGMGGDRHAATSLINPKNQHVLWTQSHALDSAHNGVPPTIEWLQGVTSIAIDGIHSALLETGNPASRKSTGPGRNCLFAAAHQILGMSLSGQTEARTLLRQQAESESSSAIANAWYAFSFANSVGERNGARDGAFFEEAEAHCARALEREPSNGLVLALVAHVYGFVLRRLDAASELAKLARMSAPDLALVWDLSAMNAIYRDDAETGHEYSLVAQRLGKFSPYKPLYDSSVSISATLTGHHALAIETAEALLQRQPGFLAAMRYLSASLVADGRIDDARQVISDIRLRDPEFRIETIRSKDYPLPSELSRQVISAALAKI